MKCEQCQREGKRSKVYPGQMYTTAMWSQPYYDEDGVYHHNDPNILTAEFSCSNGHRWRTVRQHGATRIEELERVPDLPPVDFDHLPTIQYLTPGEGLPAEAGQALTLSADGHGQWTTMTENAEAMSQARDDA